MSLPSRYDRYLIYFVSSRSLALPTFQFWSSPQTIQEPFCSSLSFLTAEQRTYCQNNPKIFSIITRSLRLAIEECQYQFRNQRWNCSIFNQSDIFGKLSLRSKQLRERKYMKISNTQRKRARSLICSRLIRCQ